MDLSCDFKHLFVFDVTLIVVETLKDVVRRSLDAKELLARVVMDPLQVRRVRLELDAACVLFCSARRVGKGSRGLRENRGEVRPGVGHGQLGGYGT